MRPCSVHLMYSQVLASSMSPSPRTAPCHTRVRSSAPAFFKRALFLGAACPHEACSCNAYCSRQLRSRWSAGQLRTVSKLEKRVAAAVHLGFDRVVAPVGSKEVVSKDLQPHVVQCRDVRELLHFVRRSGPSATSADADHDAPPADDSEDMFLSSDGTLQACKSEGGATRRRFKRIGARRRRNWSSQKGLPHAESDLAGAAPGEAASAA
jgi:hypothetical protein